MNNYINRHIESKIIAGIKRKAVIAVTGARQSGKSTLLKHLFADWDYITFDNIQYRDEADSDPRLFLKQYSDRVIFDEIQKVPDLFHEIKLQVDNDKSKRFILSGSSNFLLMSKITESLTGRVSICELFPFSLSEVEKVKKKCNFLETLHKAKTIDDLKLKTRFSFNDITNSILYGSFPEVTQMRSNKDKLMWFQDYQTTVIEKDFRDFIKVKNLQEFNKLYKMLAFQTGNLLNYSNISGDLGISAVTTKEYINLLVSSYQFFLLYPYFRKLKTRLVKTPKLYSFDTGLTNFLERITDKDRLFNGGRLGNIFENWILTELVKQKSVLDIPPDFYFWRTSSGHEVDLIIDYADRIVPIEIKSSAKLNNTDIKNIIVFIDHHKKLKLDIPFGVVIYLGDEILRLAENIIALPAGSII